MRGQAAETAGKGTSAGFDYASPEDNLDTLSRMWGTTEPGKIANWLGKPKSGIKGLPFEYEYVRL